MVHARKRERGETIEASELEEGEAVNIGEREEILSM